MATEDYDPGIAEDAHQATKHAKKKIRFAELIDKRDRRQRRKQPQAQDGN
jgi:hypothetical protein